MKSSILLISLLLSGSIIAAKGTGSQETNKNQMLITIGPQHFTATLAENATAAAFKAMLPLTLQMDDLNNNEKVIRLPEKLPVDDSNSGRIQAGDLMIWSSRSLVLFYKTFSTSYRYTRLGRIHDVAGLSAAVGSGNITAIFELKPEN